MRVDEGRGFWAGWIHNEKPTAAVDRALPNPDRPWAAPRVPHRARESAPPVTCNPGIPELVNQFLQAIVQWIEKNIAK
jgi:hypothetical protein